MAKVMGFNGTYKGLPENEAWQRIYEVGKNLMPIRERNLQKKYNRVFNKETKVIRDDTIKKVKTERLVPGDIIILSKGEFVPVDAEVMEEVSLEFDVEFNSDLDSECITKKIVYQGMRVKRGKAIVKAIRTGDSTYLGEIVKQIDNKNYVRKRFKKEIHKYFNIIGVLGLILMLFGIIFSLTTNSGEILERLSTAILSGLLLFLSVVPIGSILAFIIKLVEHKKILRKSNLIVKKYNALIKSTKISVVCIDESFLGKNYEQFIQGLYELGITIVVISEKGKDEVWELAKNSGIFENECNALSGTELENMSEENFNRAICDTVIYYEVNKGQKSKIIKGFKDLNIKTLGIISEIDDLPTLEYVEVGVCKHHRKKSLDYELSDVTVIGSELSSICKLIKGSYIVKNYFGYYIKYYVVFQLPIVISLLVALLAGIQFNLFYIQTTIFITTIIPLLLMLLNKDYKEESLCELKSDNKKSVTNLLKSGILSIIITIALIGIYMLLQLFNIVDTLKVSIFVLLLTFIDFVVIKLERNGNKEKKKREKITPNKEEKEKNYKKLKVKKEIKSQKLVKQKKIKKKVNIEDMKDQIM